jgi:hypothetical protein
MPSESLEKLGQTLIESVRDRAIADWDKIIDGRMKGLTANAVRAELEAASPDASAILAKVLPRIVDATLHNLLATLEREEALRLVVGLQNGSEVNAAEESDGLSGELYGQRGWIARFSKQRHNEGA